MKLTIICIEENEKGITYINDNFIKININSLKNIEFNKDSFYEIVFSDNTNIFYKLMKWVSKNKIDMRYDKRIFVYYFNLFKDKTSNKCYIGNCIDDFKYGIKNKNFNIFYKNVRIYNGEFLSNSILKNVNLSILQDYIYFYIDYELMKNENFSFSYGVKSANHKYYEQNLYKLLNFDNYLIKFEQNEKFDYLIELTDEYYVRKLFTYYGQIR